jgi:glycerol-3-phosphate acyltransferase PlsY
MVFVVLIVSYLLGSLAWSVWIGLWLQGVDLRDHGSGNAGATNAFRVLGTKPGVAVLILDALKGFAAIKLVLLVPEPSQTPTIMLLAGFCSVLGHLFPLFAGFRGGKGIATLLGVVIALHSGAALLSMSVFIVLFLITRIVSISSMAAALSLPFWLIFRFKEPSEVLIIFSIAVALMVLATHRKNIVRLFKGEESKVRFSRKTRSEDEV